jgi:hypothetical protein
MLALLVNAKIKISKHVEIKELGVPNVNKSESYS